MFKKALTFTSFLFISVLAKAEITGMFTFADGADGSVQFSSSSLFSSSNTFNFIWSSGTLRVPKIQWLDGSVSTTSTSGSSSSGSGGGSSLEVFNQNDGVRSSPTASIELSNAFRGTVTGSTYTFRINFSSVASLASLPTVYNATATAGFPFGFSASSASVNGWNVTSVNNDYFAIDPASSGPGLRLDRSNSEIVLGSLTNANPVVLTFKNNSGQASLIYDDFGDRFLVNAPFEFLSGSPARFYDTADSNYVGLKSSSTISFTNTYVLPVSSGAAQTAILTDGSNNLFFGPVSSLTVSGVTAGSYTNTNLTVDAQGRITSASNGSSGGGGASALAVGTGTASNFTNNVTSPTAAISFHGNLFRATTNGSTSFINIDTVTSGGLLMISSAAGTYLTLSSATATYLNSVLAAASYQPLDATLTDLANAPLTEDNSISVDAISAGILPTDVMASSNTRNITSGQMANSDHGDVSWTSGVATVDNVAAANIASGVLGSGVIASSASATMLVSSFPATGVTAASYTNTNLTVDAQGRITAASNGSSGGGGTSALAVGTGTAANFTNNITSPTAAISFHGNLFRATTNGSTSFITIDTVTSNGLLMISSAAGTYLTLSSATATYLNSVAAAATYQPLDATLTDLASAPLGEDNSISVGAIAAGSLPSDVIASSVALSGFFSDANVRTNLGLAIGTNVQAYDADLDDLADGSLTGSKVGDGVPAANIAAGALDTDVLASSYTATGVTAGSYTNTNLTVDAQGRISAASNGSSGSGSSIYNATSTAGFPFGLSASSGVFTSSIGVMAAGSSPSFALHVSLNSSGTVRGVVSNLHSTSGQDRRAFLTATGDNLNNEISLVAGKRSNNDPVEMLNGTTFIQFATGGAERARMNSTGSFLVGDGTPSTPSISILSDPNNGLYKAGTDQIGIVAGGIVISTFTSATQLVTSITWPDGTVQVSSPSAPGVGSADNMGNHVATMTLTTGFGILSTTGVYTSTISGTQINASSITLTGLLAARTGTFSDSLAVTNSISALGTLTSFGLVTINDQMSSVLDAGTTAAYQITSNNDLLTTIDFVDVAGADETGYVGLRTHVDFTSATYMTLGGNPSKSPTGNRNDYLRVNISTQSGESGKVWLSGYDCSANTNGGALTIGSDGKLVCSDDDSTGGSGGTSVYNATATAGFPFGLSASSGVFTSSIGVMAAGSSPSFALHVSLNSSGTVRGVVSNTHSTSGQDRRGFLTVIGDNLNNEISLIAGKRASNDPVEMLNGTTFIQFATGGTERGRMNSTGSFLVGDGTPSTPSVSILSDPNNGMYKAGTDQLGLVAGGIVVATFTTTGVNTLEIQMDGTPDTNSTVTGPTTNTFNSSETITSMDLVVMSTNTTWLQADANVQVRYEGMLALSLESKTVGQAMKVALPGSFVRNDSWNWTPGAVIYMSETAGAITTTQPTTTDAAIRVIGFAINADVIYFYPSQDYVTHT